MIESRKEQVVYAQDRTLSRRRNLFALVVAFAIVAALSGILAARPALAQNVDSTPAASGTPVSADDVNIVARQLWCPLCSGVRLDVCELKACAQMKDEISIMLSRGEQVQQIKDTFVARYGPQVLGEPPRSGWSWLAWALPFIVLVAGGVFLYMRARTLVQPADTTVATAAPKSDYDRKLDDELNQNK